MGSVINVLHVDDEPNFASMTADLLEREHEQLSVETVHDAQAGLELLTDDEFDCVVSDFDMPEMDGIEFLEAVRERDPDLPFILFTGRGSEEVASRAISAGVTDYLQKETGLGQYELLANRIENVVDQYRTEQRAKKQARILMLLRDINETLLRAETTEAVERAVVEILAETEQYRAAWFGRFDREHARLVPRRSAGILEEQLSPTSIREHDSRIVEDAFASGEAQVHDGHVDLLELWDAPDASVAYEGVAVVPIVYHDAEYGLVTLFSGRPDVFDEDELNMLEEVAGDVAQAYHTAVVQEELRQHQTAVEAVPEGMFLLDTDGTVDLANERAASMFGTTADEAIGTPFPVYIDQGIFSDDIMDWYVESLREMLSSESDREEAYYVTELNPPSGEPRTVEIHLTLRPYDNEYRGTVGVIRDLTDEPDRPGIA